MTVSRRVLLAAPGALLLPAPIALALAVAAGALVLGAGAVMTVGSMAFGLLVQPLALRVAQRH